MGSSIIKPDLIRWAFVRSGRNSEDYKYASQIDDWLNGSESPSIPEARELSRFTRIPFGYFFLPTPPAIELPIPDFRTVADRSLSAPSLELIETLNAIQLRQDWIRKLRAGWEPFFQVESKQRNVDSFAKQLRELVALDPAWTIENRSASDSFRDLRLRLESLGVLVFCASRVGFDNNRRLETSEFRGFALYDNLAPTIFVNSSDHISAQLFTLVHEFAHIALGSTGLSGQVDLVDSTELEEFCNEVSGELLMPASYFNLKNDSDTDFLRLSSFFCVSPLAVARRALALKLISHERFFEFRSKRISEFDPNNKTDEKSKPNFHTTTKRMFGDNFSITLASEFLGGELSYSDARAMTSLKYPTLKKFCDRVLEKYKKSLRRG